MKKRMKSLMAAGLTVCMCLPMAACGSGSGEAAASQDSVSDVADTGSSSEAAGGLEATSDVDSSDSGDKVITFWNVGTEGADKDTYEM